MLIDLEVSPNFGAFYDRYETTPIHIDRYQWIMCAAWKWLDEDKVYIYAQPDFSDWKKDKFSDLGIVKKLHKAMSEADIVVAHNAKKFDLRKANTRFVLNDLDSPRPFKVIDTLQIARRHFGFIGNSLNDLCIQLGIGKKKEKTHSDLWQACMNGDKSAWKHMKEYNKHDIILLEGIYKRLYRFIENFPITHMNDGKCRRCGSSNLVKRGFSFTKTSTRQRLQCVSCGSWDLGNLVRE